MAIGTGFQRWWWRLLTAGQQLSVLLFLLEPSVGSTLRLAGAARTRETPAFGSVSAVPLLRRQRATSKRRRTPPLPPPQPEPEPEPEPPPPPPPPVARWILGGGGQTCTQACQGSGGCLSTVKHPNSEDAIKDVARQAERPCNKGHTPVKESSNFRGAPEMDVEMDWCYYDGRPGFISCGEAPRLASYFRRFCPCGPEPCASSPCQNGGTCANDGFNFTCTCVGEWGGKDCSEPPCQNHNDCGAHGTCVNNNASHICNCTGSYSGTQCQLAPCDATAVPVNHSRGNCTGMLRSGERCVPRCDENHPEGPSPDGYYMSYPGYRECQDGVLTVRAQCSRCKNCEHRGTCVPKPHDTIDCNCSAGWNGKHCTLEDSCLVEHPCQNGAKCSHSTAFDQGYNCSCPAGFKGRNCSKPVTLWNTLNDMRSAVPCPANSNGGAKCKAGAARVIIDSTVSCWTKYKGYYLSNCTDDCCQNHGNQSAAEHACVTGQFECGGIVLYNATWQTRRGFTPLPSPSGEDCWVVHHPQKSNADIELEAVHHLCLPFAKSWRPLVGLLVSVLAVAGYIRTLLRCIAIGGGKTMRLSRHKTLVLVFWALIAGVVLLVAASAAIRNDRNDWYWVTTLALLALLTNIPIAILWWSQKHRCGRAKSTVGSRLWRGVMVPLIATVLAGLPASAVYIAQVHARSRGQIVAGTEMQWRIIESVWAVLSFGVLLPALPITIAFANTYHTRDQVGKLADAGWVLRHGRLCRCRAATSSSRPAGDSAPCTSPAAGSLRLSGRMRGGEFSQFSGVMFDGHDDADDDQAADDSSGRVRPGGSDHQLRPRQRQPLTIQRVLVEQDIGRPDLFLWAQSGFVRLSVLVPFAVWVPYIANEMQVFLLMARRQADNPLEFRARFSIDGVKSLAPVVGALNLAVVVGLFLAVIWYPAPQIWSPFLFFGIFWSCAVVILVLVVTVALMWSLSETKKQAVLRNRESVAEFRRQMMRDSFALQEMNKSLLKKIFQCVTSWHGQTLLSTVNHLLAIGLFVYGMIEFSAQLTPTLWHWLLSGVLLSALGLFVSGVSIVQRKWPVLKCTPTDDSFRLACVLKIALVMTKSTIVFLLAQVDDKVESFDTWETVVSVVSVISLLILALVTISLAARKVAKHTYLLEEAGVQQPRMFIILYIVSFLCSKCATIFFMMQGHVPDYVHCTATPVLFAMDAPHMQDSYMKGMTNSGSANCTMCYIDSDDTNPHVVPTCQIGELVTFGSNTSCWTKFKDHYLSKCTADNCENYGNRSAAERACISQLAGTCGGIVSHNSTWQTRVGSTPQNSSSGEDCWVVSLPSTTPAAPAADAVPQSLPEFCQSHRAPGSDVWYVCQTSCTRLFFNGGGTADQSLVVFVLAPMLWLPFAVYCNNECAQLIDGCWFTYLNRQSGGSSAMRIGLSTTSLGYYSIAPLIHAVTVACGVIILVFICTGNSSGYTVDTTYISDPLYSVPYGTELLDALPRACKIVTIGSIFLNMVMLLRVLAEMRFAMRSDGSETGSQTMLDTLLPDRMRGPTRGSLGSSHAIIEAELMLKSPSSTARSSEPYMEPEPELEVHCTVERLAHLVVGDRVRVWSETHECWYDGVVRTLRGGCVLVTGQTTSGGQKFKKWVSSEDTKTLQPL